MKLNSLLALTELVIETDVWRFLVWVYLFLLYVLVVAFSIIHSIDKHEYLNDRQKYFIFKRPVFFVISYTKNKRVVSKKTFILEVIGYLLAIASIVIFIISLNLSVRTSYILMGVMYALTLSFTTTTSLIEAKVKKIVK